MVTSIGAGWHHTVLLALLFFAWMSAALGTHSFSKDVPRVPYEVAYRTYFRNYDTANHCILRWVIEPTGASQGGTVGRHWGCTSWDGGVGAHSLLLLGADGLSQLKSADCKAAVLETVLRAANPPLESAVKGIGLVVAGDERVRDECDVKCLLDAVQGYNALQPTTRYRLPNVTAVFFSNDTQQCSPPCDNSCGVVDPLLVPRVVRGSYDFEVLFVADTSSSHGASGTPHESEWTALVRAARFNRARWLKKSYPHHIVETRSGEEIRPQVSSLPSLAECLNRTSSSFGCSPLGGWTVWGSSADTMWEWNEGGSGGSDIASEPSFVKKTRKGAIALMVASTAVSLVHGATPGADCPASGIVAALAVVDVLKRTFDRDGAFSRDVYVFFFPGEHLGSIGSSRFISDATQLECARKGVKSCSLAYAGALNFTTVNFSAVDTFVSIDQVAMEGSPLFYHVDHRVSVAPKLRNAPQVVAEKALENVSVSRGGTRQLPYSPITTVLDLLSDAALDERTFLTLTRYNTTYANPNVFTPRDSVFQRNSVSLNAESIAEAANALLAVLLPDGTARVNLALVRQLWSCFTVNIKCSYLELDDEGGGNLRKTPDYSVGALDSRGGTGSDDIAKAIQAALKRVGWGRALFSFALPRGLKMPDDVGKPFGEFDEKWINEEVYRNARYALHVVSKSRMSVGARSTTLGSYWESVTFFIGSVAVCALGFAYLKKCAGKALGE